MMTADNALTKAQQIEAAWAQHTGRNPRPAHKPRRKKHKPKRDSEAEEIELLLKHI